jgi:hypothetical protein
VESSRHVIPAKDRDLQQVLAAISRLQDQVIVSIASSAAPAPAAFSQDRLQALLSAAPEHLYLETIPREKYREWAANHVAQRVASVGELRSLLRSNWVTDVSPQVRSFLADCEELLHLLTSYVRQVAMPGMADQVETLNRSIAQLSDSCFKYEDNVRCMDSLQYEVLPPLKKLQKLFEN